MIPGEELESDNVSFCCVNTRGGEGQSSILADLDGDTRGRDASGKPQESGGNGGETHVSDR